MMITLLMQNFHASAAALGQLAASFYYSYPLCNKNWPSCLHRITIDFNLHSDDNTHSLSSTLYFWIFQCPFGNSLHISCLTEARVQRVLP
jgi:hypothetical protein